MLHRLVMGDITSAIIQPVAFVVALLLGFGALSAPYAIAVLIREYVAMHFVLACAISIAATMLAIYATYLAARGRGAGRVLYLPVLVLEMLSFWGVALLFGA